MTTPHEPGDAEHLRLSALMDGEQDPADWAATCEAWRSRPELQAQWQLYHLIGDAMRSEDLASHPSRDNAFLQAVRRRLADEPVVLAPVATEAPVEVAATVAVAAGAAGVAVTRRRRLHWLVAPGAVAAGFVTVAGVLVVLRGQPAGEPGASPALASASMPATVVPVQAAVAPVNGTVLRDARLDRYLSAHRQVSNGVSMMVPGGVVRSVETIVVDER